MGYWAASGVECTGQGGKEGRERERGERKGEIFKVAVPIFFELLAACTERYRST